MEFIVNLGLCNDKLACVLKIWIGNPYNRGRADQAYFSHPPISMARLQ